jgi:hypothetical protein
MEKVKFKGMPKKTRKIRTNTGFHLNLPNMLLPILTALWLRIYPTAKRKNDITVSAKSLMEL